MTSPKINLEATVTLGNIIEIAVILLIAVMAFATVRTDLGKVKERQDEMHQDFREYRDHVSRTYVRRDVFEQILIRLESIDRNIQEGKDDQQH